MALEEMERHAAYCCARKRLLQGGALFLRWTHLRNCLIEAHAKRDKKRARQIKEKMEREASGKMWYWINRSQKDRRCGSFHTVQRVVNGVVEESQTREETERFIFDETEVRIHLATDAPISSTKLIEQLGYLGDSEIAQQIVEGRFEVPDEVDDATALVLEEIGRIGIQLSNGDVSIDITPEEFQYFWRKIREETASSYSGVHYGHYKAATHSDRYLAFLAKKITLVARTGCPPERWGYGLTVMLEKIAGIALVNKL